MAELPSLGAPRQIARSNRVIVSDRSGEILGDAVERAGAGVQQVAAVRQEREDRFAYAKAKSALLRADIEARRELERDQDFETHERRYSERMAKARDEATALIRSPADRALFSQDADIDILRGTEAVRGAARTIEVDKAMADLSSILEANRAAALEAKDEGTRAALIQASIDAIAGARAQYGDRFTEVDAAKLRQQWTRDYAEGYLAVLPAAERIEVLSKPEGTPAQYLQPDERAKLLKQTRDEDKELRIRSASMAEADRIMEAHGEDRGEALAAARKISDPEVRDAATSRINARFAEIEAIENKRNEKAFEEASARIEQGQSVRDLDAVTWLRVLTQPQRQALEQRERQLQSGDPVVTDQEVWYSIRLQAMDNPEAFAKRNLLLDRPSLSDTDFQQFAELQAAIRTGDRNLSEGVLSGVRTANQIVSDTLREIGVNPTPKPGTADAKRVAQFSRMVDERVVAFQLQAGRKATTEDVQTIVDDLVIKGEVPGTLFGVVPWNREARLYEVGSDESFSVTDVADVPAAERTKIEAALQRAGRAVTNDAILTLYNLKVGRP